MINEEEIVEGNDVDVDRHSVKTVTEDANTHATATAVTNDMNIQEVTTNADRQQLLPNFLLKTCQHTVILLRRS